jgi:hypothetical protein
MSDVSLIFRKYSIKYERKLKKICAPLVDSLQTPIFTYCFVEDDGRFGYISNALEFNDFYFSNRIFLQNPYLSHPAFFRSGHAFIPCPMEDDAGKLLKKKFNADHLLFILEKRETRVEYFIFANENIQAVDGVKYLPKLNLYQQFSRYFKRECKDILGRMSADQYNIQKERGPLFEEAPSVPLVHNDPHILSFLKQVSGLSPQELRCLEMFKMGYTAQSTAAFMGLSRRTVESYFDI